MRRGLVFALAGALVLAGCSEADAPSGSSGEPDTSGATQEASQDAITRWLTPVELDDPPRALTELEETLLHEPGPFARSAAAPADALLTEEERAEAAEAAAALDPETSEEWIGAVLAQVHGDYVDEVRDTVHFDASTGEGAAAPTAAPAGPGGSGDVGVNHYAIVLDASSSMAEPGSAGTRMDEAKAALERFLGQLPETSTVSLRVYGHEGSGGEAGRAASCATSDVVFAGGIGDRSGWAGALREIAPVGWTPLALGIRDAQLDIPSQATDSVVYVVTDGLETCGGDPVAAAGELASSGIRPIVNVIGFQAGDADQAALAAIAAAGGGDFTAAGSGAELDAYWQQEQQRMQAAWAQWRAAESTRIAAAGGANQRSANVIGEAIKSTANAESQAGKDVSAELERQGRIDRETASAIWNWFNERSTPIWGYGNETASQNWSAAQQQASADLAALYELADRSWTEYYRDDGR